MAILFLVPFLACAQALHVLHERRSASSGWVKQGRVDPCSTLSVRIGLTQTNLDKGHEYLLDVSDPASPNYAKYWTADEVIAAFAPTQETVDAVTNWVIEYNVSDQVLHHDNKGWLAFDTTAAQLEALLLAEFHEFEYRGKLSVACDEYHVPSTIQHHIDYITPGIRTSNLNKRSLSQASSSIPKRNRRLTWKSIPASEQSSLNETHNLSHCDKRILPDCIRALYQLPDPDPNRPLVSVADSMGVYEEGSKFAQEDLNLFYAKFAKFIPANTTPIVDSVDGGIAPTTLNHAGGESELDLQLALPIIYPQPITVYQINGRRDFGAHRGQFNIWLDSIDGSYCTYCAYGECGDAPFDPKYPQPGKNGYKGKLQCGVYKPTKVVGISYGVQEIDLPAYYQKRQCNEFMKLGLQGTSVLVASGDDGAAAFPSKAYPQGCLGPRDNIFSPTYPNNCPYVTNVGATIVPFGNTVNQSEHSSGYSGGGFSNIYPQPSYQKPFIDAYFNASPSADKSYNHFGLHDFGKLNGVFNRAGHGIPDVSANGGPIITYLKGKLGYAYGTSASVQIFAAIINRINEERLAKEKKPLGFLNPALYANPSMLNDVTEGHITGCGFQGVAFKASKSWDPASGLGTPNYPKMLKYFMSLQ